MQKITLEWLATHQWVLSSCNTDKTSYGGYQIPDGWDSVPNPNYSQDCDNGGFYGITPEYNDFGLSAPLPVLYEVKGDVFDVDGDKVKYHTRRAVAFGADIPLEAFETCGIRAFFHKAGDEFSPIDGEYHYCFGEGEFYNTNQQGGYCWAWGDATIHNTNQQGGDCRASDNAAKFDY